MYIIMYFLAKCMELLADYANAIVMNLDMLCTD